MHLGPPSELSHGLCARRPKPSGNVVVVLLIVNTLVPSPHVLLPRRRPDVALSWGFREDSFCLPRKRCLHSWALGGQSGHPSPPRLGDTRTQNGT